MVRRGKAYCGVRRSACYIIVLPQFSVLIGMRNRLCHELHACHCNPECDISLPVDEDHMATTGCRLKSSSSSPHMWVRPASREKNLQPCPGRFYCLHLQKCSHLAQLGLHPSFLLRALSRGGWGKKVCVLKVYLERKRREEKKSSSFKQNGTDCPRTGSWASRHLPGCREFIMAFSCYSHQVKPTHTLICTNLRVEGR